MTADQAALATLALVMDLKKSFDDFTDDIEKNFMRKNEKRELEQKEINDKVRKMWGVYSVQLWMAAIIGANLIALIWALITDKITIVAMP